MNQLTLFNLALENVTLGDATEMLMAAARAERPGGLAVTPNVDHIVMIEHDAEMRRIFRCATYRFVDGMPLVWLSRLLVKPGLVARVTGSDLLVSIAEAASRDGTKLYFLGGLPGVADRAAMRLRERFPGLIVAGSYCPPFGFEKDEAECRRIVQRINNSGASILFIGVGTPKQEKWVDAWMPMLNPRVMLGVGAAFDFVAGTARRAPALMQRWGLEWLWRLARDPRRLAHRYLIRDSYFAILAAREFWRVRRGA